MTAILGVSAFYHDSAAALVVDGQIVAAAQEERFTRIKNDASFPANAVRFCLEQGGLKPADIAYVGFYDKPLLKFDRLLETYLAYVPRGLESFLAAMPVWLKEKLWLRRELARALGHTGKRPYVFTEHHEAHAASAFFPSPFDEAAILTVDGVGEWATASYGAGRGNRIAVTHELRFPHSLGLLYSAFTLFCGFKVNSDEYKLMGLAPYGEPRYVDTILEHLVDLREDGSFRLDMSYFNYCEGLTMTSKKFEELFEGPPRRPGATLTRRDMDLAASAQHVTDHIMVAMARHVRRETGLKNLCLAGGVALNCVANRRILEEAGFERLWIQPAAGDAGGALGVALFIWHQLLDGAREPRGRDCQRGSLLGPSFTQDEIRAYLDGVNAVYDEVADDEQLCEFAADRIASGDIVGWFQGPMEFGPRALGARSILGDARNPEMQTRMNLNIKFRESFRPFAPAVLQQAVHEYFETAPNYETPYMLEVAPVRQEKRRSNPEELRALDGLAKLTAPRSVIPAVTHVDYSARLQTVDSGRNPLFYRLIAKHREQTGCPVIVNTSFNLGWEPIVCTPADAYRTFMSSEMQVLCLGRSVLTKSAQPACAQSRHAGKGDWLADLWWCPRCRSGELARRSDDIVACTACGHQFTVDDNVLQLFWPHDAFGSKGDVTMRVKSFYEENPFPNYDDHDTVRSLIDKSRQGQYARALDEALPYNAHVLEVGCGTGQLTNFLGVACRRVVGTDVCLNSLKMAENFRRTHRLDRVRFVQMNLFRPCLKPASFDAVICNGVLHHTGDPVLGFNSILALLRPGGYIVIGLYNRYGRLATDLRRLLFRLTRGRVQNLDPYLRSRSLSKQKRRAWFADQYLHPHESKHTIDEVLDWFDAAGLEFVRAIPSVVPGETSIPEGRLFEAVARGSRTDHLRAQLKQTITGSREGGFFLMIGRKSASAAPHEVAVQEAAAYA